MKMSQLSYQVSFNVPAFLGNAEQQGQWRAPPFKALLRQWWRVVHAPLTGYDFREILKAEQVLFGSAGGNDQGGRSQVQIRLSRWDVGTMTSLPNMKQQEHCEVKRDDKPTKIGTAVYLGFGPVTTGGNRSGIAPTDGTATLSLRFPSEKEGELRKSMQLAAWFGTLGSRSRNGWGSLHVLGEGLLELGDLSDTNLTEQAVGRSLPDALSDRIGGDWPHALGLCADDRPAIWRVVAGRDDKERKYLGFDKWQEVLEKLARIKIDFRTQFKFSGGKPHMRVEDRHILGYPITNHELKGLANARLASQLRFKIVKNIEGKYFGLIFHLPCAMPTSFFALSSVGPPAISDQIRVWRQVHEFLNAQPPTLLARIRKG